MTKMMKLAPGVEDALAKINYIDAIPEMAAAPAKPTPIFSAPVSSAGSASATSVAQAPKTSGVVKKQVDKSVKRIKLEAAKNFAAGQEAAANAGDVYQVSNNIAVKTKVCTVNQDEDLDDCVAAAPQKDEDQDEVEQLEAFDLTNGSRDYGSAAGQFATNVSQKRALADDSEPAAAAAASVAAPAAEEKQADKAAKKLAVNDAAVKEVKEKIEQKAEAKAQAKLAAGDVKGGLAELKKAAKKEAKVEKKIKEMQKEVFANKSGSGELKQDLL